MNILQNLGKVVNHSKPVNLTPVQQCAQIDKDNCTGVPVTRLRTYTTTIDLKRFCQTARNSRFVAIDTEFVREKTYFPKLCLLQMAVLSDNRSEDIALFDTLSPKLDLEPLREVFADPDLIKVLHAARQDMELFLFKLGILPKPVFDTQIAALACGLGEQISYEQVVSKLTGIKLGRSSQMTDWARRPLTDRQLEYAASDVDHLRYVFVELERRLRQTERFSWIEEETAILSDPATYLTDPKDAWQRLKNRKGPPIYLAILREVAKVREELAQKWDIPRRWVMSDEAVHEIAQTLPTHPKEFTRLRFIKKTRHWPQVSAAIIKAVAAGRERAKAGAIDDMIQKAPTAKQDTDLLHALLNVRARELEISGKLIATSSDLQAIAAGDSRARPLRGWRREVFGKDALKLCQGRIALTSSQGKTQIISVPKRSLRGSPAR